MRRQAEILRESFLYIQHQKMWLLQTFVVSKSRDREEWASKASGRVRQVWENINVRAPSSEDMEKCSQYPTSL